MTKTSSEFLEELHNSLKSSCEILAAKYRNASQAEIFYKISGIDLREQKQVSDEQSTKSK